MRLIDEIYVKWPFYGARRIAAELRAGGWSVDRKRVGRLMRLMGIQALYPGPRTSTAQPQHRKYPYLLRGLSITHADHVWSSDITYIPMKRGFLYLVAVMDWYSRFVLSWQLSNSLDTAFCIEALEDAFRTGKPKIFNSDQGCQYTSVDFTAELQSREIAISMDGRGRFWDNIWSCWALDHRLGKPRGFPQPTPPRRLGNTGTFSTLNSSPSGLDTWGHLSVVVFLEPAAPAAERVCADVLLSTEGS